MTSTKELPPLTSLGDFILDAPLYSPYQVTEIQPLSYLYGKSKMPPFDGYCSRCKKETVYYLTDHAHIPDGVPWRKIETRREISKLTATCGRASNHTITCYFYLDAMKLQKLGQYPSLADISLGELKDYRKDLSELDATEFTRAIGLAAHGVGVGSFVCLRRVFERLIYNRFEEFKDKEGWDVEEFKPLHMEEKIDFLSGHLPSFLVDNSKIYSILSVGIHSLTEEQCLAAFEMMKESIIVILEEDQKNRIARERREKLEAAVAAFEGKPVEKKTA